jgi:serine/threonine protein kinase
MIGRRIANYRIEAKLGEGGMGVVYRALDLDLDRPVALKLLSADLARDPALIERFRTEAKSQAHLNHANIATLYSFLQVAGDCVIVMEYVEGETFDELIRRRGPIPHEDAVPLFRQALLGIGFAHRMAIIHRDIKPSNLMVNRYGIVKVMDFGIAKAVGGRRLTRTGVQVGTVCYMSPEQVRNTPVSVRSDIYSLGVTLYEMLSGHVPFESDSDFQVMSDHVNTPPEPPTRFYPYIPRGIEQAVLRALEKDPAARFQTVEEFGAALEHTEGSLPGVVARPPVSPVPISARTSNTPPQAGSVHVSPEAVHHPTPFAIFEALSPKNRRVALAVGSSVLVLLAVVGLYTWRGDVGTDGGTIGGRNDTAMVRGGPYERIGAGTQDSENTSIAVPDPDPADSGPEVDTSGPGESDTQQNQTRKPSGPIARPPRRGGGSGKVGTDRNGDTTVSAHGDSSSSPPVTPSGPNWVKLAGRVVSANGQPLPGVRVIVLKPGLTAAAALATQNLDQDILDQETTGADGGFETRSLVDLDTPYSIILQAPGLPARWYDGIVHRPFYRGGPILTLRPFRF